ncbi:MAG: hypothetical protein IPK15_24730 [Verrucomicrobia bacterium]|nr:hypothetical protein [Verrucomicrobiota bacterium]
MKPSSQTALRLRSGPIRAWLVALAALATLAITVRSAEAPNSRRPESDVELKYWLENMVWHHRYSLEEIRNATGLETNAIASALQRFNITAATRPRRERSAPLLTLPYPGGRHPRIGFLDGAIDPQRETKVSVFTPWDDASYVVVDVPEALWSNLGLTYLAHTHIPTIFDKQGVKLPALEWDRRDDGTLSLSRRLPNGISYAANVIPGPDAVRMELWLTNGTSSALSDLRVQNCVMLKNAIGFNALTNANKIFAKPFVAARNDAGDRWIITAWEPCDRPWANPPVPCLHSDPKFPNCAPGESQRLRGWFSFYEGTNVQAEFTRIAKLGWLTNVGKQ